MQNVYCELEDFLDEISTHVRHNPATHHDISGNSLDSNKVVSALYDVASWAVDQSHLYQLAYP